MVMQTIAASNTSKHAVVVSDEADFLEERNSEGTLFRSKDAADKTPLKRPNAVAVSPDSSPSLSSGSSTGDLSEDESADMKKITKTEHRLLEESGDHYPEPLLMENPGRFVLFPIEDNDVSATTTEVLFD
jgi:hypothetical protein